MRPFFLFRLRASADFNLAFCPGGMKNACFFASLIISSVITLRLKRRNALSIDSPWFTVTIAILSPSFVSISNRGKAYSAHLFKTSSGVLVKLAFRNGASCNDVEVSPTINCLTLKWGVHKETPLHFLRSGPATRP